ncbi:MAG TPA: hypothetical protein VLX61_11365 [Anaerolineales bacterium]|nr:hypothetical protein [Anaerolineales bacterium]
MKARKIVFAFLLGILFTAIISAVIPQTVYAACGHGTEPPCPPSGKKKQPTAIPSVPTAIPTLTPNPTATSAATIPLTGGGGAGDPNGQLPAVQNLNPGSGHMSFPFGFPGGLAGLMGLLLLLGGLLIGLLVPAVRSWLVPAVKPGSSSDGSDKMGAQPHMNDGSDQGIVIVNSNSAAPQPHTDASIGNPDLNIGTPSEVAPGPTDMPGPTQGGGGLV